jgi:hypothetical protein
MLCLPKKLLIEVQLSLNTIRINQAIELHISTQTMKCLLFQTTTLKFKQRAMLILLNIKSHARCISFDMACFPLILSKKVTSVVNFKYISKVFEYYFVPHFLIEIDFSKKYLIQLFKIRVTVYHISLKFV